MAKENGSRCRVVALDHTHALHGKTQAASECMYAGRVRMGRGLRDAGTDCTLAFAIHRVQNTHSASGRDSMWDMRCINHRSRRTCHCA
ncbi:hypothetical protein FH972_022167 [Carpinus fangiana]|uniref:Uncharacterized protein n=1 Tax=Carpinus fangiana TaxID=176857 RepID=A0A5N6KRZ7_9ROSI|nr:hypothetical protein FH972_022167 [Carpinus fangiana]